MGRTREFADDQALQKAMKVFWEKGYEHSSLKELLAAMDILNGSFYNTFGSKKNLFIKSLEAYYEDMKKKRTRRFESPGTFKVKIRAVFDYVLDQQKRTDCPRGCFLVNSLSADVLENEEIRVFVLSCINDFEEFLHQEIRGAIAAQELDAGMDAAKTAGIINIYLQGLLKLCVLEFAEEKMRSQTDYFLSALGL